MRELNEIDLKFVGGGLADEEIVISTTEAEALASCVGSMTEGGLNWDCLAVMNSTSSGTNDSTQVPGANIMGDPQP